MSTQVRNHVFISHKHTEGSSVYINLDGSVTVSTMYSATFKSADELRNILDKLESDMAAYKRKHNF